MELSHVLLSFFVVISLVFIVSANDGGYKILSYGEDFPAYPWQRINHREWIPPMQRREYPAGDRNPYSRIPEMEKCEDGVYRNICQEIKNVSHRSAERTSTFEEKMAEVNNFGRGSGVKVIYGRVPVPVLLIPSYDKPQH